MPCFMLPSNWVIIYFCILLVINIMPLIVFRFNPNVNLVQSILSIKITLFMMITIKIVLTVVIMLHAATATANHDVQAKNKNMTINFNRFLMVMKIGTTRYFFIFFNSKYRLLNF